LARIDFPNVEHVTLIHSAAIEPTVLDGAPVEMRLPVPSPFGVS
jgi:hypothetical protein